VRFRAAFRVEEVPKVVKDDTCTCSELDLRRVMYVGKGGPGGAERERRRGRDSVIGISENGGCSRYGLMIGRTESSRGFGWKHFDQGNV
jgi:hypothetical protein